MGRDENQQKKQTSPNKQKKWFSKNAREKKLYLKAGQKGFFATCNFQEKPCIRETYNILNEYSDELYNQPPTKNTNENVTSTSPQTTSNELDENELDISDDLQKEINNVTKLNSNFNRFQNVNTEISNCLFFTTTLDDPAELGLKIVSDISEKKLQKTRHLIRLIPILAVCKANLIDVIDNGGKILDKYFLHEGKTFSIIFNRRYNKSLERNDVIESLSELIFKKNINNKVDLKNPELSVIVEVIKGLCCLGIVHQYFKFKKYNLMELGKDERENENVVDDDDNRKAESGENLDEV